jgi:hypothetical protein
MAKPQLKVEGAPEAQRAFNKVADKIDDLSDAHRTEAEALLSDVQSATRQDTGELSSAWRADGIATEAQFLNDMPYANIQEYGSRYVEPTLAVQQAFEANTERTEAVYADALRDIGESAGFDTK